MGLLDNLARGLGFSGQRHDFGCPYRLSLSPEDATNVLLVRDGATPVDRQKMIDLLGFLGRSPSGASDAELMLHARMKVRFDSRPGGALFQRWKRLLTMNRLLTPVRTATEFVHEATHAREWIEGRAADVENDTRNAFVTKMLREETKTYLREALVGRELLHISLAERSTTWRELLTAHPLQMYFQLVHGVRYHHKPSAEIMLRDRALRPDELQRHVRMLTPHFARYVSPYNKIEGIKWDIVHGKRPPMDGEMMAELLGAAFSQLDPSWRYPRREEAFAQRA